MRLFYGRWVPGTGSVLEAGLDVVKESDGVFKVKSAADAPDFEKFVRVQLALDSPWSTETTVVAIDDSKLYGRFGCGLRGDGCKAAEESVTVPRWQAALCNVDDRSGSFAVRVWRSAKCETLEEAKAAPPPVLADAGFFLMVFAE